MVRKKWWKDMITNRRCDMAASKKQQTGKRIKFSLNAPEAREVLLAGDFNSWDNASTRLKRSKDNVWARDLLLRPGRYEYKFIVDGNWISDPNNDNRAHNPFGTDNSVIEI